MTIIELADRLATALQYYMSQDKNAGKTLEDKAKSRARYMLAEDACNAAEREYRAAVDKMSADQLIAASREFSNDR